MARTFPESALNAARSGERSLSVSCCATGPLLHAQHIVNAARSAHSLRVFEVSIMQQQRR